MASGMFGIARTALLTHQTSLQVVSHNVANAETPGYSRQRPMLSASTPVRMPYGNIGTGVRFDGVERQRDVLLDRSFRSASTLLGESSYRRDALSQVEELFGEPSEAGMAASSSALRKIRGWSWACFMGCWSGNGSGQNVATLWAGRRPRGPAAHCAVCGLALCARG
jgi:hypothetical protein